MAERSTLAVRAPPMAPPILLPGLTIARHFPTTLAEFNFASLPLHFGDSIAADAACTPTSFCEIRSGGGAAQLSVAAAATGGDVSNMMLAAVGAAMRAAGAQGEPVTTTTTDGLEFLFWDTAAGVVVPKLPRVRCLGILHFFFFFFFFFLSSSFLFFDDGSLLATGHVAWCGH